MPCEANSTVSPWSLPDKMDLQIGDNPTPNGPKGVSPGKTSFARLEEYVTVLGFGAIQDEIKSQRQKSLFPSAFEMAATTPKNHYLRCEK